MQYRNRFTTILCYIVKLPVTPLAAHAVQEQIHNHLVLRCHICQGETKEKLGMGAMYRHLGGLVCYVSNETQGDTVINNNSPFCCLVTMLLGGSLGGKFTRMKVNPLSSVIHKHKAMIHYKCAGDTSTTGTGAYNRYLDISGKALIFCEVQSVFASNAPTERG